MAALAAPSRIIKTTLKTNSKYDSTEPAAVDPAAVTLAVPDGDVACGVVVVYRYVPVCGRLDIGPDAGRDTTSCDAPADSCGRHERTPGGYLSITLLQFMLAMMKSLEKFQAVGTQQKS